MTDPTISHSQSDSLRCPHCDHPYLLTNQLGISSQQDPCRHLVVFETVFTTTVRISSTEFESDAGLDRDRTLETILPELSGQVTVVRDADPEDCLDNNPWKAVYQPDPETVQTRI